MTERNNPVAHPLPRGLPMFLPRTSLNQSETPLTIPFSKWDGLQKSIVQVAQIMVFQLSPAGKILFSGGFWPDFSGCSNSETQGNYFLDYFTALDPTKFSGTFLSRKRESEYANGAVFRFSSGQKHERFVHWTFQVVSASKSPGKTFLGVGKEVTRHLQSEKELLKERLELIERNKELTCLYGMALLVEQIDSPLPGVIQSILSLIPPAFQFPSKAGARIFLDGTSFATSNFRESKTRMKEPLSIQGKRRGFLEVVYLPDSRKTADRLSFLKEEFSLIRTLAKQVTLMIEKKEADERKTQLEGQLRHADRLAKIGQLAAGVAHELNEPLASVLGFSQLSAKIPNLPAQVYSDLENIVKSALHAREVIKKLMLFSRQIPSQQVVVNLNTVIEEGLYFLENRFAKSGIEVRRKLCETLPDIVGDPSQLHQVLVNLVINAYQAMPQGGILSISTYSDRSHVHLVIEDTGMGMDQETQKHIFLPFFTTKEADKGTGLGLSVVHGIITVHGGKIAVESETGKGSRFDISFPLKKGKKHDEPQAS